VLAPVKNKKKIIFIRLQRSGEERQSHPTAGGECSYFVFGIQHQEEKELLLVLEPRSRGATTLLSRIPRSNDTTFVVFCLVRLHSEGLRSINLAEHSAATGLLSYITFYYRISRYSLVPLQILSPSEWLH
jgi:hypothetical protein